jgi:hypothetical protein
MTRIEVERIRSDTAENLIRFLQKHLKTGDSSETPTMLIQSASALLSYTVA